MIETSLHYVDIAGKTSVYKPFVFMDGSLDISDYRGEDCILVGLGTEYHLLTII